MNISFRLLAFPECGLCMNVLNVSLSWPFQHIFIVCWSQCESPNILMFLFCTFVPILPDFVQNVSFYCFSSVEACLPGNTMSNCSNWLLTVYVPKVLQNVSFSIKDVWTEKLLVVAFNLATPGRKNPIGTCSLWQIHLKICQKCLS